MRITLPYPDKDLSPNARKHWGAVNRKKKDAVQTAFYIAKGAGPKFSGPVIVNITINPPDARRRDIDNAIASCKAYFDGIALAIGVDDSLWTWGLPSTFGEQVTGGRVDVEILPNVDAQVRASCIVGAVE